jgi:hypothetical protein
MFKIKQIILVGIILLSFSSCEEMFDYSPYAIMRVGSRGLYIASKFGNSSIPLSDIIELGFGVAVYR